MNKNVVTQRVTPLALAERACRFLELVIFFDLVWFGLVCQGLRSSVPYLVRAESLAAMELEMAEGDARLAEASYSSPNVSGCRRFVGHPDELAPCSRLSRAFARVARARGNRSPLPGVAQAHEELASFGITASFTCATYVSEALRELVGCLAVHLVIRLRHTVYILLCHFVGSCVGER